MNTDYWYQGVLQIEGCKKDIICFLTKGIEAIDANGQNVCTSYPFINKIGDVIEIIFNLKDKAVNFKIKDIDKNIMLVKKCNVYDWHDDNDIIIIGLGIRFERLFFEDFLKTVFNKYKISFKLYKYGRQDIYKTDFKNFLYTQCEIGG